MRSEIFKQMLPVIPIMLITSMRGKRLVLVHGTPMVTNDAKTFFGIQNGLPESIGIIKGLLGSWKILTENNVNKKGLLIN